MPDTHFLVAQPWYAWFVNSAPPPPRIGWLFREPDGVTRLSEGGDAAVPCRVDGPLPVRGCALVTISVGGASRRVVVAACPDRPEILAVVDAADGGEELSGALENLVNQIAHDIRNYAFTIGLQTEMGLRRGAGGESQRHLEAVLRQIDALKGYLEKLLLYGRPARLDPRSFALEAFLREEVQRFQFGWDPAAPPLRIHLDTSQLAGSVRWDQRAIAAVLAALLDNAARSAASPPPIAVGGRRDGERVVLEIRDQGPGMSAETLAAVAVPMKVRRAGAAGLGLAIVRKFVRAHGGEFRLASDLTGTTATIILPAEVPAA